MKINILSNAARLAIVGGALLLPPIIQADTGVLVADTSISPGSTNFGGNPTINVGGGLWQGLVRFDLTAIPSGIVASAKLRLYCSRVDAGGSVDLSAVNGAWSEATVTGATAPAIGALLGSATINAPGYVTLDVTAQVASWLSGATNNGFFLTPSSGSSPFVYFDSKESSATSHPATLEVIFAGAPGANGATGAAGPTGASGPTGAQGLAGAIGPLGPVGPGGPAGASGSQGPTGPTGVVGAPGNPGVSGPSGAAGLAGAAGAAGTIGNQGSLGAAGPSGPSGPTGATGNTGSTGPQGVQGATGIGYSNTYSIDTTVHSGSYTIPDNSTSATLVTGAAAVTLPKASTLTGKKIWIVTVTPGTPYTIQRQGSDLIFRGGFAGATDPGETSYTNPYPVEMYSNGSGWYQTFKGQ